MGKGGSHNAYQWCSGLFGSFASFCAKESQERQIYDKYKRGTAETHSKCNCQFLGLVFPLIEEENIKVKG